MFEMTGYSEEERRKRRGGKEKYRAKDVMTDRLRESKGRKSSSWGIVWV